MPFTHPPDLRIRFLCYLHEARKAGLAALKVGLETEAQEVAAAAADKAWEAARRQRRKTKKEDSEDSEEEPGENSAEEDSEEDYDLWVSSVNTFFGCTPPRPYQCAFLQSGPYL
ncbi:hypothetical protein MMC29_004979 [Sticta canariensis]|nr:hypothetical protein [Sticta canariensis]